MRKIFLWHILGIVFTVIFGSFLHFAYQISGNLKPVALIAAINESSWEHLKIAFWPAFLFGIFEYFLYGKKIKNFFLAKTKELWSIPFLIVAFFYGYTAFIKDSLVWDISIFVVSIIIGFFLSFWILKWKRDFSKLNLIFAILLFAEFFAFCLLTFFPPHNFLFLDPISKTYGFPR